uniref:Uncharacterized protein n=1 Tax=Glossina palpalis gambiensis TaxID=67801 RepID=A0A1B0BLI5_9MUSC
MSLSFEQKTLEYLFICKRSTPTDIFLLDNILIEDLLNRCISCCPTVELTCYVNITLRRHCDKRDQSPACVQYLIYEIVLVLLLLSLVAAITSHSYCHSSVSHNRVSDFDKASNMHNSEQSRHHISYPYVTRANECGQTLHSVGQKCEYITVFLLLADSVEQNPLNSLLMTFYLIILDRKECDLMLINASVRGKN